ncbi:MAG: bifunctional nuclease family protein [Acidimicrobiia bacterium]|nr:bifunctional nuclease family protein [Acidimicrobiia bacterium]MYC58532.1 bifunctional nuclease family protein [Acidimicrobiia bacterium]MYG94290.1 bifunctional nuclease family protein [Acidimicrobiia bacterium]MYI30361.1 bifunctional nuclease family protein [Acidimicrobiia bacterium]
MIEMELIGVRVELPTNAPIVLLREVNGGARLLPIFIGGTEAQAIALALEEVETPRPMTHDLFKNVLDDLGVRLERIIVTELRERTFFAELEFADANGQRRISSRPSDAFALAVRSGAPIFASEEVLAAAGHVADMPLDSEDEPPEEVLDQFREFLDQVNPEDFNG